MAWAIREAFFAKLADIADASVLGKIFAQHGVPLDQVETCIRSGEAFAVMSGDMQLAREQQIRSSPTLIFNEDRQRLSGNVGYRIIEANIRELLEKPRAGQSWC
jgi:predicted DsbA family dithiol-disulfide isomerase